VNKKEAQLRRTQKEAKMRAIDHTHTGNHGSTGEASLVSSLMDRVSQFSESIWLGITFLLFIVMGPFSVIAVVYGLWSLGTSENRDKMLEPASLLGN